MAFRCVATGSVPSEGELELIRGATLDDFLTRREFLVGARRWGFEPLGQELNQDFKNGLRCHRAGGGDDDVIAEMMFVGKMLQAGAVDGFNGFE